MSLKAFVVFLSVSVAGLVSGLYRRPSGSQIHVAFDRVVSVDASSIAYHIRVLNEGSEPIVIVGAKEDCSCVPIRGIPLLVPANQSRRLLVHQPIQMDSYESLSFTGWLLLRRKSANVIRFAVAIPDAEWQDQHARALEVSTESHGKSILQMQPF